MHGGGRGTVQSKSLATTSCGRNVIESIEIVTAARQASAEGELYGSMDQEGMPGAVEVHVVHLLLCSREEIYKELRIKHNMGSYDILDAAHAWLLLSGTLTHEL